MPRLSPDAPLVHPDCEIADSSFGAYTEVGRGSRIAQMVVAPVARAELSEVNELDETRRGEGGFGSTGHH